MEIQKRKFAHTLKNLSTRSSLSILLQKGDGIMAEKDKEEDLAEIFIDTITKPADVTPGEQEKVRLLLHEAKEKLGAENARFRLRSWDDRSVVHVPNWIIGSELEQAEPELAQRVYFDYRRNQEAKDTKDQEAKDTKDQEAKDTKDQEAKDTKDQEAKDTKDQESRIDCIVGLVARQARIEEEELKEKPDEQLIERLKKGFEYKYEEKTFSFDDLRKRSSDEKKDLEKKEKILNLLREQKFKEFKGRLAGKKEDLRKKKEIWGKYFENLEKTQDIDAFFKEVFDENSLPEELKKVKRQWEELRDYVEEYKRGNEFKEFLDAVKQTANRYRESYNQYEIYISEYGEAPREIVVPVMAFGKFIGVLNFHKSNKSTRFIKSNESSKRDYDLARIYAARLAAIYLHWQKESYEVSQRVAQTITAENDFEVIASNITDGIRKALEHGLKKESVFPILYVAKRPISKSDDRSEKEFEDIWKETYQKRHKPEDNRELALWDLENKLGEIPIRADGLGSKIIEQWAQEVSEEQGGKNIEARDRFIECLDVDNPNSEFGSRSAYYNSIKTTGCLLLTFRNQVYGLLYIHCRERHFFTEVEFRALNALGTQAAIAIKNAGLTGESYEKLYGAKLPDLLISLAQAKAFGNIGEILKTWADLARHTRGNAIADITIDTMKKLSVEFKLPEEFDKFIDEFRLREGAFQSLIDYREHFIHLFHVFCLGYVILCQWKRKGKELGLLEPLAQHCGTRDENYVLKIWFVAAIYHDVGYPSEKFEILVRKFFETTVGREIKSQFDWSSVLLADKNLEHIKELSELFATKTNHPDQKEVFEKWFLKKLLEDHDHGVLTALILLQEGERKIDWKKNGMWDLAKEAALAIALHNYWKREPDEEEKEFDLGLLAAEDLGLSFFLTFCDTAQEWGRTALLELMKAENIELMMSAMKETNSILEDIEVDNDKTVVTIRYSSGGEEENKRKKTLGDEFKEVNAKFRSAWRYRKKDTMRLEIRGKYYRMDSIKATDPQEK
jgi:GAF domain-containing protein